ncbi:hypothetical protein LCGC14_0530830 [marine sediment metagenome]|uniref:Leucine-rich repeat domain-containing protein n=1 Tax=marine sediment metagenome TaxID=412755 RepID=A0A0F9RVR8_9ZZZZ|nr:MAG: leucine-rich repeat domain protein [Candidatus Lokiarchaeum sp. GC14_75]
MSEFRINNYITLKLEDETTNIYVNDELFNQCASILFQLPTNSLTFTKEIESIDDVIEKLGWSREGQDITIDTSTVSPEQEFRGHCSNLQVWAENNYNSRLLHSNLSFPLLKKLTEVGDPSAKKVFKEEIAERFEEGNQTVILYLFEENYIEFLGTEELDYVIENSELIDIIFKNGNLEYDEFISYFNDLNQKSPNGLKRRFFNENNILKDSLRNLLEEFKLTRYYTLEILNLLYGKDLILKEPLYDGIAEIFRKGSFELIYDLLSFPLEETKSLEVILEKIWNWRFFTMDTPVVKEIVKVLNEDKPHAKNRCMKVLKIIWRYMENNLTSDIIRYILADKENCIDLLLQIITVWYEGTFVLNSDSIKELKNLGDEAVQKLKKALRRGQYGKGYFLNRAGELNKLSFRVDLQYDWPDFHNAIDEVYSLFGAQELIEFLDDFEGGVDDLININKSNYPGPLKTLSEAFIECSEMNDSELIDKAYNVYRYLDEWIQEQIIQSFPYGETIYDQRQIIKFCLKNNEFDGIRFFLNFNILLKEDIGWLLSIPDVNFLEKLIESQKELKYPSMKYDQFIEEMVYDNPQQFIKSIHQLKAQDQKSFVTYVSDLIDSFTEDCSLSFLSFLREPDSINMRNVQEKIGKMFRVLGDSPYIEVGFSYEDGLVTELIIEWCNLESVPVEIETLSNLKRLTLRNNLLKILPESLGKLKRLEFLDVSRNPDLSDIPNNIKYLIKKKHLLFKIDEKGN